MNRLLVGLGNPGKGYAKTRHNIGWRVIQAFAQSKAASFTRLEKIKGEVGIVEGEKLFLLLPRTYMNLSGTAVKQCMDRYNVALKDLLVIADDVALPFGNVRLRLKGSSGGHNGLKSIEASLRSQEYARLKIGIGDCGEEDLAAYVLAPFTKEEEEKIPSIMQEALETIQKWLFLTGEKPAQTEQERKSSHKKEGE